MLNHSWKKGYWPIHVFTILNYQVSIQFINVIFKLDFMLFLNFNTKLRQLIFLLVLWTGLWSFFSASWNVNSASTELCRCNFWHQGVAIIKRLSGMYNDSVKLVSSTCVIIEMIHCYFPYLLRVHCKWVLAVLSTCGFTCEIIVDICCCCCN